MPKRKKKTRTVREIIIASLKCGRINAEVLTAVKKVHPRTTYSLASINWYRNRLRSEEGMTIPSERECRRRRA